MACRRVYVEIGDRQVAEVVSAVDPGRAVIPESPLSHEARGDCAASESAEQLTQTLSDYCNGIGTACTRRRLRHINNQCRSRWPTVRPTDTPGAAVRVNGVSPADCGRPLHGCQQFLVRCNRGTPDQITLLRAVGIDIYRNSDGAPHLTVNGDWISLSDIEAIR